MCNGRITSKTLNSGSIAGRPGKMRDRERIRTRLMREYILIQSRPSRGRTPKPERKTMVRKIDVLRNEIADLDRDLLELIERRFRLAAEVGRFKAEQGLPVTVKQVEERVKQRARDAAATCGVSPGIMDAIFGAIINGSVERQYRVGIEERARIAKRLVVLGAAGSMGGWLSSFLGSIGHRIEAVDPAWLDAEGVEGRHASLGTVPDPDSLDGIFVATPLGTTEAVLQELADGGFSAPIFEIASIKSHLAPVHSRLRKAGRTVYSIHPMFGPSKNPYQPLTVIHAVLDDAEAERQAILEVLTHPYLNLVSMPFAEHDRISGWLLGLSHLTGMLFAAALTRSGTDPAVLHRVASTSFERQAATSRSVLDGNSDLFFSIQRLNPYRGAVYAALSEALSELTAAVEGDDRTTFAESLARAEGMLPPE